MAPKQSDGLRELALFAGAGGGILGGKLLGWRCVCAVEIEPYCREILQKRQNEGHLRPFPIWDDVRTFDGHPWRGKVDVISGGFPCQDISAAGEGKGLDGERSGLWSEMARICSEVRPRFIFVENSPLLVRRGLAVVLGDMAEMGYNARWGVVSAADTGAPHLRERIWIVATDSDSIGLQTNADERAVCEQTSDARDAGRFSEVGCSTEWPSPCPVGAYPVGMGDGVAEDLDRIKACGNGQVPRVVAAAWRILGG